MLNSTEKKLIKNIHNLIDAPSPFSDGYIKFRLGAISSEIDLAWCQREITGVIAGRLQRLVFDIAFPNRPLLNLNIVEKWAEPKDCCWGDKPCDVCDIPDFRGCHDS